MSDKAGQAVRPPQVISADLMTVQRQWNAGNYEQIGVPAVWGPCAVRQCNLCGALVIDPAIHIDWHASLGGAS